MELMQQLSILQQQLQEKDSTIKLLQHQMVSTRNCLNYAIKYVRKWLFLEFL